MQLKPLGFPGSWDLGNLYLFISVFVICFCFSSEWSGPIMELSKRTGDTSSWWLVSLLVTAYHVSSQRHSLGSRITHTDFASCSNDLSFVILRNLYAESYISHLYVNTDFRQCVTSSWAYSHEGFFELWDKGSAPCNNNHGELENKLNKHFGW